MKIAISGKGGVGKTTLAGVMARILARRGHRVIAIDADPDSNLASALGINEGEARKLEPLAQMQEFIEERTGTKKGQYGAFFQINPRVDDIPERFSLEKDGVRLIVLGSIPQGGGGCFCPENALLRSFLSHVLVERDDYVIVDMEAGLEHLGRATTEFIDALIVVVEPGKRSFQTAFQVKRLGEDIGIKRVYAVGNKVAGEKDLTFMKENLGDLPFLGYMAQNEKIIDADKRGLSPYDADPQIGREIGDIVDHLAQAMTPSGAE
ncbi:MAG TPA: carbon monoxide dehydrogenase accessory protein CooC [Syntrophorhabdaceae bacterium]|nr:carbon monoxide dehydrogenase accessory protein CooC [Syntrophorhabdaceae bacterium]